MNIFNKTVLISLTLTRPNDVTAYAALDAVANSTSAPTAREFTGAARARLLGGYITKAKLLTDQSANTARFRLHLFNAAVTAINDNAAHTLLWSQRDSYLGSVDFSPCATEGGGSTAAVSLNTTIRLPYQAGAAATDSGGSLWGLLETLDAFTPAANQNFHLELACEQN